MKIVYLIGNGFDINIGLNTRYMDFYKHYTSIISSNKNIDSIKKAIGSDHKTWSDLEIALGNHTSLLRNKEEFEVIFEDITDNLASFLEKEEKKHDLSQVDKTKFYHDLSFPEKHLETADTQILERYKDKWASQHWQIRIITFNYTKSIEIIVDTEKLNFQIESHHNKYQVNLKSIDHIHGYTDNRLIMGVNDSSQIKNENLREILEVTEAFVKPKCNEVSKSTIDIQCDEYIKSADLICLFGSSIGETDKLWWAKIGKRLLSGVKLIIFHKGDHVNRRRLYKNKSIERSVKKRFLAMTELTDQEKEIAEENIFIAINTSMFSLLN